MAGKQLKEATQRSVNKEGVCEKGPWRQTITGKSQTKEQSGNP